ncbi:MAG: gliding motility-associated C-terminal domain-containing protein [Flavobacterium sp.]
MKKSVSINLSFIKFLYWIVLFIGFNDNLQAQCPTVANPAQTFCDTQFPKVSNLVATDTGGGISWFTSPSGGTPLAFNENLVTGDYWADNVLGTCPVREKVSVIIYTKPTGEPIQRVCYIINSTATISSLIVSGNDIKWYSNPTGGTALPNTTVLTDGSFYYASQTNPDTNCESSRLKVQVSLTTIPDDPTGNPNQTFCNDPSNPPQIADLTTTSANTNWYIDETSNVELDPSIILENGSSYYAAAFNSTCESINRFRITVTLTPPITPTFNQVAPICEGDVLADLPTTSTNGIVGSWLPEIDNTVTTTYTFTPFPNQCADTTTMTIIVNPKTIPTFAPVAPICSGEPLSPLPTTSVEGITGTWTPALDNTITTTYIFTPSAGQCVKSTSLTIVVDYITPSFMQVPPICSGDPLAPLPILSINGISGTWFPPLDNTTTTTYTFIPFPGQCASRTSMLIIVNPLPIAGNDNTVVLCKNGAAVDLADYLGIHDLGGTWTPALANDNGDRGTFNPALDLATVYTYTVQGLSPCTQASATISVTVNNTPNSGISENPSFCETEPPVNLFDSLIPPKDTGGTWNPALNGGYLGTLVPSENPPGLYTYTYTVSVQGCTDAHTDVIVNIQKAPNSGISNTLFVCDDPSNTTPIVLFNSLLGTPDSGGTWTHDGNTHSGVFNPIIDSEGIYTYTVTGIFPCNYSVSTEITISKKPKPDAGTDAFVLTCQGLTVSLYEHLGTIQTYGTWNPPLYVSGVFTPGQDTADFPYIYTIDNVIGCAAASATAIVTVEKGPDSGLANTIFVCDDSSNTTPIVLFDFLLGTPDSGGTWTFAGNIHDEKFDPTTDSDGIYTYTVTGISPCNYSVSTELTVTKKPKPDAGIDALISTCQGISVSLYDYLGTTQTYGIWNPPLYIPGVFTPGQDIADSPYVYTINNIIGCAGASSTAIVTVNPDPYAGMDGNLTMCPSSSPTDLINYLGDSPMTGGTWTDTLNMAHSGTINSSEPEGIYTYKVTGQDACSVLSDEAIVTVKKDNDIIISGGTIDLIPQICPFKDQIITVSQITGLSDSTYALGYEFEGVVALTNTNNLDFTDGATSFVVNGNLLTNSGTVTVKIINIAYVGGFCPASVSQISPVNFEILANSNPVLTSNGNEFCNNKTATLEDLTSKISGVSSVNWYDSSTDGTLLSESTVLINGTTYYAAGISSDNCENPNRLAVTAEYVECEPNPIIAPDGFSPNGDGINDTFVIQNLRSDYPNFSLKIFNRYGNVLYKGNNSTPDWDGNNNTGKSIGDSEAPTGVYFFTIDFNNGKTNPIQGRLYLSR